MSDQSDLLDKVLGKTDGDLRSGAKDMQDLELRHVSEAKQDNHDLVRQMSREYVTSFPN